MERHGTDVFELEAVSPETLADLLTETIDRVLNLDLLNEESQAEERDAAFLAEAKQRACLALPDL